MRGYLTGVTSTSIWSAYESGARVFCGHALPEGMRKNEPLPPGGSCARCTSRGRVEVEVRVDDVFTPAISEFLPSYHFWQAHGVLPEPGGLMQQPATWLDAAYILDVELAKLRDQEQQRAEAGIPRA